MFTFIHYELSVSSQGRMLKSSSPMLINDWGHRGEVLVPLGKNVKLVSESQEESLVVFRSRAVSLRETI